MVEYYPLKYISDISVGYRNAETFKKGYLELLFRVTQSHWGEACHATSAILFALARHLGIEATLCIGEAAISKIPFDHSWLEIDGKSYDVAIAVPLKPEFSSVPVFAGLDILTKKPTEIEYGIHASGLDDMARTISQMDVYDYVSSCPNPDLRLLTKIICKAAGKPIDDASIEKALKGVKRKCV